MNSKVTVRIVAMLAIAAVLFAVMGGLMQSRIGHPLSVPQDQVTAALQRGTVAVLLNGIRGALTAAQNALQEGRQSEIARALDASMRAAGVGKDALSSTRHGAALERLHESILKARVAFQNDNHSQAAEMVRAALASTPDVENETASTPDTAQYTGATVLNAEGVRVGEVKGSSNGAVLVSLGGYNNLFGFVDIGGQTVQVPADYIIYGKQKALGTTFVVLPSLSTSPGEITAQLRAATR